MSGEARSRNAMRTAAPAIPGYRIVGVIGRGATGVVYRARQLAVDRMVALKVLHLEKAGRKRVVSRLQREARTTARLSHPHIVSAFDLGEIEGIWWFAMELVDGPSLALRLREGGALREREALRFFIPLCEALVHLWEHGVVHRDIKPGNILIDDTGGARLADLGLAFAGDDPTVTEEGGTLGTPHYISPEQAVNASGVDCQSDIWSFGATLFHAVCGAPPFRGGSTAEVLSGVLHARIVDPQELAPQLSRGLSLILRKCLSRDLDLRYRDPRELLSDLERVRERRAPQIDPRALEPLDKASRPLLKFSIAGVLLALAAGTWILMNPSGGEQESGVESQDDGGHQVGRTEELVRDALAEHRLLAPALSELEWIAREEDPRSVQAAKAGITRLRMALRSEITALHVDIDREFSTELERGDYDAAAGLLQDKLASGLLRRTGFELHALPSDLAQDQSVWRADREVQIDAAQSELSRVLRESAESYYENVILPAVDRLQEADRWQSALDQLSLENVLTGVDRAAAERLGPELQSKSLSRLESRLKVRRARVLDHWSLVDAELHQWLAWRALRSEEAIAAGGRNVAAELRAAFDNELEARGIVREELPAATRIAALDELERQLRDLEDLERRTAVERAKQDARVLRTAVAPPLWRARDFDAVAKLWTDFSDSLDNLPAGTDPFLVGGLRADAQLQLREAGLLKGLLERAAAGLEAADGMRWELSVGNIRLRGVIDVGAGLKRGNFDLVVGENRRQAMVLQELQSEDLERLAGLVGADGELKDAGDRLLRALVRMRDGDASRSLAVLASGPLPDAAWVPALVASLRDRARRELLDDNERIQSHRREAERLLSLLEPGSSVDNARRMQVLNALIDEYSDVPAVRTQIAALRLMREQLKRPKPTEKTLLKAFGAGRVDFIDERLARLEFEFQELTAGAWQPGSWLPDGLGWSASRAGTWDAFELGDGPRLTLQQPAGELRDGELELEFELELPHSAGPPALVCVSASGYHISLAGPGLPGAEGGAAKNRLLVTYGKFSDHLTLLRRGRGDKVVQSIVRGGHHVLRIKIEARFRKVEVALDGETIGVTTVAPSRDIDGAGSIQIRAWESLRMIRASVVAERP